MVDSIISQGKLFFERVMLDNGAARSPAGLLAYLRYCAFCGTIPKLRPSNLVFKGMGRGTTPSLGLAEIRLPIGSSIALTFDIDVVDHDVPKLFGLELHKRFQWHRRRYYFFLGHISEIKFELTV